MPNPEERSATRAALVFRVAGRICALPCGAIREIVPMAALLRSPGQPPILEGFLNLRGHMTPVVDLRRLFGLPAPEPTVYTPLIVIQLGEIVAGLLVDQVETTLELTRDMLQPLAENHSLNDCAEAQFSVAGFSAVLIQVDRLLLREERTRVSELRAEVQRRLDGLEAARP